MLSEEEYRRLREDHEVAHFRADLALSDPEVCLVKPGFRF